MRPARAAVAGWGCLLNTTVASGGLLETSPERNRSGPYPMNGYPSGAATNPSRSPRTPRGHARRSTARNTGTTTPAAFLLASSPDGVVARGESGELRISRGFSADLAVSVHVHDPDLLG